MNTHRFERAIKAYLKHYFECNSEDDVQIAQDFCIVQAPQGLRFVQLLPNLHSSVLFFRKEDLKSDMHYYLFYEKKSERNLDLLLIKSKTLRRVIKNMMMFDALMITIDALLEAKAEFEYNELIYTK